MARSRRRIELLRLVADELDQVKEGRLDRVSSTGELASWFQLRVKTIVSYLAEGQLRPSRESVQAKRRTNLVWYVRQELGLIERGETRSMTTVEALAAKFGYSTSWTARILREDNLAERRRLAQRLMTQRLRADVILNVQSALVEFERRAIHVLPTIHELAVCFELGDRIIERYLQEEGFLARLQQARSSEGAVALTPSEDLAWLAGVLLTAGCAEGNVDFVRVTSQYQHLLERIQEVSELLLRETGELPLRFAHEEASDTFLLSRPLSGMVRALQGGDATRLRCVLGWILRSDRYAWAFLSGVIDVNAMFVRSGGRTELRLPLADQAQLDVVLALLKGVGIGTARIVTRRRNDPSSRVVSVSGRASLSGLAKHVEPCVPAVKMRLQRYRSADMMEVVSDQRLIDQWLSMRRTLGHPPTMQDITQMWRQKKTPFPASLYNSRFGSGSFASAAQALNRKTVDRVERRAAGTGQRTNSAHRTDDSLRASGAD